MLRDDTIKNENDPRAVRSRRDIKKAMMELIAKTPYQEITVEKIVENALINIKTFYRYFSSKADVLNVIMSDMESELVAGLAPVQATDLRGGNGILQLYIFR